MYCVTLYPEPRPIKLGNILYPGLFSNITSCMYCVTLYPESRPIKLCNILYVLSYAMSWFGHRFCNRNSC